MALKKSQLYSSLCQSCDKRRHGTHWQVGGPAARLRDRQPVVRNWLLGHYIIEYERELCRVRISIVRRGVMRQFFPPGYGP